MNEHVLTAPFQKATRWKDSLGRWHTYKKRMLLRCFTCRHRRYARNMVIKAYYDAVYAFCKPGKGCKA